MMSFLLREANATIKNNGAKIVLVRGAVSVLPEIWLVEEGETLSEFDECVGSYVNRLNWSYERWARSVVRSIHCKKVSVELWGVWTYCK